MTGRLLLLTAAFALGCAQRPPPRASDHKATFPLPQGKNCVAATEPSREVMLFFHNAISQNFALQSISFSIDGCKLFDDSVKDAVVAKTRVKASWIGKMLVPRDRAVVVHTRLRYLGAAGETFDVTSDRTFEPHEPSLKIVAYERDIATQLDRLSIRYDTPYRPSGSPCITATSGPQVHFAVRFSHRVTSRFTLRRIDVFLDDTPLVDEGMRATVLAQVQSGKVVTYDLLLNAGCHRLRVDLEYVASGMGVDPKGAIVPVHAQTVVDVFDGWSQEVRLLERANEPLHKALTFQTRVTAKSD